MSKRLQIARAQGNSSTNIPLKGEPVYDEKNDLFYIGDGSTKLNKLTPYRKTNIYSGKMTNYVLKINQPVKINIEEPIEIITSFLHNYTAGNPITITNKIWDSTTNDYVDQQIASGAKIYDMYGKELPTGGYKPGAVNSLYLLKTIINNTDTYKLFINSPIARWG